MSARRNLADFWDETIAQWLGGRRDLSAPLDRWAASYKGKGRGQVDLRHYPDPFVGDLRGIRAEPEFVFLGLNPGIGFDTLQGPEGVWSRRISRMGYSRCFERSPAEDPTEWTNLHGKVSRYWQNIIRFAGRWVDNEKISTQEILNLELYPWHSIGKTAPIAPPADILAEFIFKPLGEVPVDTIFAFGADWITVAEDLLQQKSLVVGRQVSPVKEHDRAQWRLGTYWLPSGQRLVISSQLGYAGPPGPKRLDALRELLRQPASR